MLRSIAKWAWRYVYHVFCLAVIIIVFLNLRGRTEIIVVSILGLIYTNFRLITASLLIVYMEQRERIERLSARVEAIAANPNFEFEKTQLQEVVEAVARNPVKDFYVEMVFLGLITLICLYNLFIGLSS